MATEDGPHDDLHRRARALHRRALVIDTHSDLPMRMLDEGLEIGERRTAGHQDLPRMAEGGLDVEFVALFVPGREDQGGKLRRALELYAVVADSVERHAGTVGLARSPAEVRALQAAGKIAFVLCLEGGHALEKSVGVLRAFHGLGIAYVTLTHMDTNGLADSATDEPRWNGLSPEGRAIVAEMNRLGMMVDVAHLSDRAFWDVIELSAAPPLATHSSARALAPSPRNLDDAMIRALAARGGTVQIAFGSSFLHPAWAARGEEVMRILKTADGTDTARFYSVWDELNAADPLPEAVLEDLVRHIDHVAQLAGVDHVGLGSDWEGVAHVPRGIDDVTRLPDLTEALVRRGYSDADVEKVLGGNLMRVWQEVLDAAEPASRPSA